MHDHDGDDRLHQVKKEKERQTEETRQFSSAVTVGRQQHKGVSLRVTFAALTFYIFYLKLILVVILCRRSAASLLQSERLVRVEFKSP